MPTRRRHSRPTPIRAVSPIPTPDASFPRAVPGEDYNRYARAMIWQAERWFRARVPGDAERRLEMHELRASLRSTAVTELNRDLHPQEERLLSELLQHRAEASGRSPKPEIPSFLVDRDDA